MTGTAGQLLDTCGQTVCLAAVRQRVEVVSQAPVQTLHCTTALSATGRKRMIGFFADVGLSRLCLLRRKGGNHLVKPWGGVKLLRIDAV